MKNVKRNQKTLISNDKNKENVKGKERRKMESKKALERLFGGYIASRCYGINYQQDDKDYEIINKALKALEIIKEKRVNVRAFLKCCCLSQGLLIYNNQCDNKNEKESKELTQEEFDLLKEELE